MHNHPRTHRGGGEPGQTFKSRRLLLWRFFFCLAFFVLEHRIGETQTNTKRDTGRDITGAQAGRNGWDTGGSSRDTRRDTTRTAKGGGEATGPAQAPASPENARSFASTPRTTRTRNFASRLGDPQRAHSRNLRFVLNGSLRRKVAGARLDA